MKTKTLILTALIGFGPSLYAQIPVTDVGVIAGQATELARTMEMIANQSQQITILTQQLDQAQFLSRVLGDPATIRSMSGIQALFANLASTGSNEARIALIAQTKPLDAEQYSGAGLFHVVGNTFTTLDGQVIHRDDESYKPYAAIINAVGNHDAVERDVLQRRQNLRTAMQQTLQGLQAATTEAEVAKLHGVLLGQLVELEATDHELSFASQRAMVQDIDSPNDAQRQEAAAHEEQAAEFHRSVDNLRQLLRPPTSPVSFSGVTP
jgi:hypothetical protein